MKRHNRVILVSCICLMAVLLFNCVGVYAGVADEIQPRYVATQSTIENFSINSSGESSMTTILVPMDKSKIDKVKVTLNIKNSSGNSVYSNTYDATWSNLVSGYRLVKTYKLSSKGTYRFNAVYKCYKNNSLVETITTDYIVDSY